LSEAAELSDELKNMCLFVARIDGFSIYGDTLKGYLLYEILIRARVTFWGKIHKMRNEARCKLASLSGFPKMSRIR